MSHRGLNIRVFFTQVEFYFLSGFRYRKLPGIRTNIHDIGDTAALEINVEHTRFIHVTVEFKIDFPDHSAGADA